MLKTHGMIQPAFRLARSSNTANPACSTRPECDGAKT